MKPNYPVRRFSQKPFIFLSLVVSLSACGSQNEFLDQIESQPNNGQPNIGQANIGQANPQQINTLNLQPAPVAVPEPVAELPIAFIAEDTTCGAQPELLKSSLLELTNRSRETAHICGGVTYPAVPALEWNDSLGDAARNHSIDMATHNIKITKI